MPEEAGGDHANAGGGYTGGGAESLGEANSNGNGGVGSGWCGGGGYYSKGIRQSSTNDDIANIGGQGGSSGLHNTGYIGDSGGDGGIAGKGGNIKVSSTSKIYAYNGNKYTDGTDYNNGTNQTEIYAQKGILREIKKYNAHWKEKKYNNYAYLYSILGNTLAISEDITPMDSNIGFSNVVIRNQSTCNKTGYTNTANGLGIGIGSGAGYIELSNGTYQILEAMN